MVTDSETVRRLAAELDARLRGARLSDAGLSDEGQAILTFSGRPEALVLEPFASPPLVRFAPAAVSIAGDPSYLRAIGSALRGMRLASVSSWPDERILVFDFAARSRFGVPDGYRLVVELIPRFGNVVLLKDQTIVAAAKQFGPAENQHRTILAGARYAPPPARPVAAKPGAPAAPGPEEGAVLDRMRAFAEQRREGEAQTALGRARASAAKRIARRLVAARAERERLIARRAARSERDRLRAAGDALYAFGHLVPAGAKRFSPPTDPTLEIELDPQLDAKANAAAFFARYRKLVAGLPHVERRLLQVEATIQALEELEWQLEDADAEALREIAAAVDGAREQRPAERRRKRTPLRFDLSSGARVYVGRSPQENAEVTFRIARPSDLWFHVREQPGAHVVLQPSPGVDPSLDDVRTAASAAAFFSKARTSDRVAIDYVARKHVRKQRDAPAGRVWYTNAQTVVVSPRDPAAYAGSASR